MDVAQVPELRSVMAAKPPKELTPRPWLESRLVAIAKPKIELARALGLSNSRVHELISGARKLKLSEVDRIAAFLEWSREELLRLETGAAPRSEIVSPMQNVEIDYGKTFDLPLFGADELAGGLFSMSVRPVNTIDRSPALKGNKAAYAVYCAEDSLAPRYERGQTLVIDPTRPVAPGNDVLFVSKDGNARCIRRLVAITPTEWRVQQLTPPRIHKLPKADFPTAHKIFGSRTL
jgi:SOS-response transcriptional repressor LexA